MVSDNELPRCHDNVALFVAHPGHELAVLRFMEIHRPAYFCLTDGSGWNALPRLESTGRLLRQVGATPGRIYGRFRDKELYRLLLDGRVEVFQALASELAGELIDTGISLIAGDAMEGFNPAHDLCRVLLDSAVTIVQQRTGHTIQNYEFAVHDDPAQSARGAAIRLQLDEAALERKIRVAMEYSEMREEVLDALNRFGSKSFAAEYLRPSSTRTMLEQFEAIPPLYETIGSARVAAGRYHDVVRFHEHVLPVFDALGIESPCRTAS